MSAARISPAGALLEGSATTAGIVVTSTKSVPLGALTSAVVGGEHWLIWQGGSDNGLHGSRVSPAGTGPAGWTDGFASPPVSASSYPVLAAGAAGSHLAWIDGTQAPVISLAGMRVFPP